MDLLNPENICGRNLLLIVARGSAIIAEQLRLADNIPDIFQTNNTFQDVNKSKYNQILFDFQYLRDPEASEQRINSNVDLIGLDQEFQENHEDILNRFYLLFESIWKYQQDLSKCIEDVMNGYYIQHSLESILDEVEGKQLLCEALYLYGVMLLFMEEKLPGIVRERMVMALYRYNGDGKLVNIDEVCKLTRSTGYIPATLSSTSSSSSYSSSGNSNTSSSNNKNSNTAINGRKPKRHPESVFHRFPFNSEFLRLILGKLQTDDIYHMSTIFPNPDHRSVRLANQASMIYVILYFIPEILIAKKSMMREIVDNFFHDNWVISVYMGHIIDLTVEWSYYPAAKLALDNTITTSHVQELHQSNYNMIIQNKKKLQYLLNEGVVNQEYILDNINPLLNMLRNGNISLRWRLLHRQCRNEEYRQIIVGGNNNDSGKNDIIKRDNNKEQGKATANNKKKSNKKNSDHESDGNNNNNPTNVNITSAELVTLLIHTSQFEYQIKQILTTLLNDKEHAWNQGKTQAAMYLSTLSHHFSTDSQSSSLSLSLTLLPSQQTITNGNDQQQQQQNKGHEKLMIWFAKLSQQISDLNLDVHKQHATATGRRIQGIISALEDVEQFDEIDSHAQIKQYLSDTRILLTQMIRTANIKQESLSVLETMSDFSYAWKIITSTTSTTDSTATNHIGTINSNTNTNTNINNSQSEFLHLFHEKIQQNPKNVVLLRAVFLKMASILDTPMVRIVAADSPDAESVAQYYSQELISFVRSVLEIIPISVFRILHEIVDIQIHKITRLPNRIEITELKHYAQSELRLQLSTLTYQISLFTQGILLLQKTLLGVIQISPKEILEQGLRRELVRLMTSALHESLLFSVEDINGVFKNSRTGVTGVSDGSGVSGRYNKLATTMDGLKRSIEYLQDFIDIPGLKIYHEEYYRIMHYHAEQEGNKYVKKKISDEQSQYQNKLIPIPRYNVCRNHQSSSLSLSVANVATLSPRPTSSSTIATSNSTTAAVKSSSVKQSQQLQSSTSPPPSTITYFTNTYDNNSDMQPVNFMGRVLESLLYLTDTTQTVYSHERNTWYVHTSQQSSINSTGNSDVSNSANNTGNNSGRESRSNIIILLSTKNKPPQQSSLNNTTTSTGSNNTAATSATEVCGLRFFTLFNHALSPIGIRSVNILFGFRTTYILKQLFHFYDTCLKPTYSMIFQQIRQTLESAEKPGYVNSSSGNSSNSDNSVGSFSKMLTTAVEKLDSDNGSKNSSSKSDSSSSDHTSKANDTSNSSNKSTLSMLSHFIQRIGQSQLLRQHLNYSLRTSCYIDAHNYYQTLDNFNTSLLNDIKRHYYYSNNNSNFNEPNINNDSSNKLSQQQQHKKCYPYPSKYNNKISDSNNTNSSTENDNSDNPLLQQSVSLFDACGMDTDIMQKIYITATSSTSSSMSGSSGSSGDGFHWVEVLMIFVLHNVTKLEYDADFGSLVSRGISGKISGSSNNNKNKSDNKGDKNSKSTSTQPQSHSDSVDGTPLVAGIACVLKQLHPMMTPQLLHSLGVYIRVSLQSKYSTQNVDKKVVKIPYEIKLLMIFIRQLCHYLSLRLENVYAFIPRYIFDSATINANE